MMRTNRERAQDSASVIEETVSKPNGENTVRKYIKGKLLGKGGFAKCYEIINNETKKVSAAKIVCKASLTKNRAKQKLMSEIKIHRSLHHPSIVNFEHFFEDSENVYIILELCTNQTLNELVRRRKKLTELEVQCYMAQLIEGLKYLQAHRVIHRDLKLGNLFLTEKMELKIGDFGLATKLEFDGERKRTICGTPNYIAPEVLESKQGHSYEVDVWSLGVIFYTLLIGKPPFETQDVKTTYRRIKMNMYTFPESSAISDSAKNLIQQILCSDPKKRPGYADIMNHPFFAANKIPALLPASTLACPPSVTFTRQYIITEEQKNTTNSAQMRLESTAPYKENKIASKERARMLNTERGNFHDQNRASITPEMPSARTNPSGALQNKPVVLSERPENTQSPFAKTTTTPDQKASLGVKPPAEVKGPDVWVKKWVDYSSKYGLGYYLSNGAAGVCFNDSTKIILDPNGCHFDYLEKHGAERQDAVCSYNLTDYPKTLQKKVTLLQHFRSYLEGEETKSTNNTEGLPTRKLEHSICVKKWLKTKHAIMFRLSNKIVQVNFQDATEIILSSESKVVTYVNKKRERNSYPLNSALESTNAEMAKRLKYAKEILTKMLSQNNTRSNNAASQQQPANWQHNVENC